MAAERDPGGPAFACDAMCGGLARWLRALGYDATFSPRIDDGELVRQARGEGRILISSDSRLFERRAIRLGEVKSCFLPRGMKMLDQVRFVVSRLGLTVRDPRCMACGGELERVDAAEVGDRVPARSLVWATEFFECRRCGRVFWNGTHWRRIDAVRRAAGEWTAAP
ncbi:MAG: Mut7-C RNAse domain-containing protein [Phycisphaerae bacterium]|nr:Mut7-C RNAse domain-containing protein [Phycisphaerae bacterium]